MPISQSRDNISLRIPSDLKAQFASVAEAEGRTMTVILIRLIEDYIQQSLASAQNPLRTPLSDLS